MRRFLLKTSAVLSVALIILTLLLIVMPEVVPLHNTVPRALTDSLAKYKIIICGDSRADRMLDPDVVAAKTGLSTINFAESSGEIYGFSKCLAAAGVTGKIVIISASSFQLNDGAVDMGYFGLDSYREIPLGPRFAMYRSHINAFLFMQEKLFEVALFGRSGVNEQGTLLRPDGQRFDVLNCKLWKIDKDFRNHAWYKSPELEGAKKPVLLQGLDKLAALKDCKILIYNAPVSTDFYELAKRLNVLPIEKTYDSVMTVECRKRNIYYHSFLEDTTLRDHQFYYDPQHMCREGVVRFSPAVTDLLFSLGIVKKGS